MQRGEVHFVSLNLPDWGAGGMGQVVKQKLVVVLRGGPDAQDESYVPVVLCDTDNRTLGQELQPFEVGVDEAHGFNHPTILDCRWVFSLASTLFDAQTYRFRLQAVTLGDIAVAVTVALQL